MPDKYSSGKPWIMKINLKENTKSRKSWYKRRTGYKCNAKCEQGEAEN
jgi:hypothetical protein